MRRLWKSLAIVCALVLAPALVLAMSLGFERTWGGAFDDRGEGVAIAPDGSVYLAGRTASFGTGVGVDGDAFVVKYDAGGSIAWQRTWGTGRVEPNLSADEFANDVAVAGDGSVYITGFFATGRAFLVKFDEAGRLIWERTWGDPLGNFIDFAEAVDVAPDGSVYMGGWSSNFGAGQQDAFLVKFSAAGDLLWDRMWGGPGFDTAHDIEVAPDGSIYVAGDTNSFFANDALLVKFDSNGSVLWAQDWRAGTIEDLSGAFGVSVAPDGSVYLAGNASISGVGQDIFLLKFTSAGALVWEKTWGDRLSSAHGVTVAANGNIFVTGNTGFGQGGGDAFVVQFLPTGRAKEARTWGGVENDSGESIAIGADGSVFVGGVASTPPYVFDRARHSIKTPVSFLATPAGIVTDPNVILGTPAGTVTEPVGSETFGGATDAMLLRIVP